MSGEASRTSLWRPWFALVTLLLLGIASGAAWRWELETRGGWGGLVWISYFHWAVPLGGAGFIVWVSLAANVRHRWKFAAVLCILSLPAYWMADTALSIAFGRIRFLPLFWADAGVVFTMAAMIQLLAIGVLLWLLVPFLLCLVGRAFGHKLSAGRVAVSVAGFIVAWPLAVLVRMPFETIGSSDFIHALKSGFVVPFLILSLGIPFLPPFRLPPGRTAKDAPEGCASAGQPMRE